MKVGIRQWSIGRSAAIGTPIILLIACGSDALVDQSGADLTSDDVFAISQDAGADADACMRLDGGIWVNTCPRDAAPRACVPDESRPYSPGPFRPPTGKYQGHCSKADVEALYYCVFTLEGATDQKCERFAGDGAARSCLECALTDDKEPKLGPSVLRETAVRLNVAGCIALAGDDASASCAEAAQALDDCQMQACFDSCVHTGAGRVDMVAYQLCRDAAARGMCAKEASAQRDRCPADVDGGPQSTCFAGETFEERFTHYAGFFCGSGPDAGASDAAADGS